MASAIYKPSQGYWTRILTAVGVGMIVLAGIVWLTDQLSAIGTNTTLSYKYDRFVTGVDAWANAVKNPAAGFTTYGGVATDRSASQGPPSQVTLTDKATGKHYTLSPDELAAAVNSIPRTASDGPAIQITGSDVSFVQDKPDTRSVDVGMTTFARRNMTYIKLVVALVIVIATIVFLYWFYRSEPVGDFMIATEAEMRKVSWPDRRETVVSTWVVIVGTFLMAIMLLAVDVLFTKFFIWIKVLAAS